MRGLLVMVSMGLAVVAVQAEPWPTWRGPKGDGHSSEKGLPTTWSDSKNLLWKAPLPGMGCSTPVVWGDAIFLTCVENQNLLLLALDTKGKEKWRAKLGEGNVPARTDEGNWASASAVTDGKHVWAYVGSGDIACYTVAGAKVWAFNLQQKYGKFNIQFGMHSTPILHDGKLYLQLFHTGAQLVISLEAATGKELWKVNRTSDGTDECPHSYASPVLWQAGEKAYLITHGNDYAVAHDLADGHELWRLGNLNPKDKYNKTLRFVASPVAAPNLIVVPTAKNGQVVALKPDATGMVGPGSKHEQWRKPSNTPDVPSPLVADGLVYLCRENGTLICLDAVTGDEYYQERTTAGRFRASPVLLDGHLLLTNRDKGTVTVVKAGKKFVRVSDNTVPDVLAASPAVADGKIYLRGFKYLWAISASAQ